MEYDGFFVRDSKQIDYLITDGYSGYTVKGKMARRIHFYIEGREINNRVIYGTDEEMTNISPLDAENWYVERIRVEQKDDMDVEEETEINTEDLDDTSRKIEVVLRERKANLWTINKSCTDVNYRGIDLLELFLENNYEKSDKETITIALSKRALENKADKEMYWKYDLVANDVPGRIEEREIRELLNILRAYKLIDCDKEGRFFVTEKGKKITDEAIIALDTANNV